MRGISYSPSYPTWSCLCQCFVHHHRPSLSYPSPRIPGIYQPAFIRSRLRKCLGRDQYTKFQTSHSINKAWEQIRQATCFTDTPTFCVPRFFSRSAGVRSRKLSFMAVIGRFVKRAPGGAPAPSSSSFNSDWRSVCRCSGRITMLKLVLFIMEMRYFSACRLVATLQTFSE